MAIRIKDAATKQDVQAAIQNAIRKQAGVFDELRDVEHELGFDLSNLGTIVTERASDVDRPEDFELTDEDFRTIMRELERE